MADVSFNARATSRPPTQLLVTEEIKRLTRIEESFQAKAEWIPRIHLVEQNLMQAFLLAQGLVRRYTAVYLVIRFSGFFEV
jgi:hypothetical protein